MSQFEERGFYLEREINLMEEIASKINTLHGMFAEYEAPSLLRDDVRRVENSMGNQREASVADILRVLAHCNTLLDEAVGMASYLNEGLHMADIKTVYGPPSSFGITLEDKVRVQSLFSFEDDLPSDRDDKKHYKVLCPVCGGKIKPTTEFCSCCGTDLSNYPNLEQSDEAYDVDETLHWCDLCRGTVSYYDTYCCHCGNRLHGR